MNLRDAVRHAQKLVDDEKLTGKDAIAVHCLVQLSKKVLRVQKPLRQLERALCPKEELNQVSMFPEEDDDGG